MSRLYTYTDPTHVIAALVAATHHAASSGPTIGRMGMDSRLRGNDVWRGQLSNLGWQVARFPFPSIPFPEVIRRT